MKQEELDKITETINGYPVKNLLYKKNARIITGQVKDPINLFPHLHDGYVGASWNVNGYPQKLNKGRNDLRLKMS
jgi:hypothetical protein